MISSASSRNARARASLSMTTIDRIGALLEHVLAK